MAWAGGFFALAVYRLRTLVLAIWSILLPSSPMPADADAIATAIASTVASEASPVWSPEIDAGVAAVFVFYESGIALHPLPAIDPKTGGPVDAQASGAFQLHSWAGHEDARTQAVAWMSLLQAGRRQCKESPAAPLSGGDCTRAVGLANRRVALAMRLVAQVQKENAEEARQ